MRTLLVAIAAIAASPAFGQDFLARVKQLEEQTARRAAEQTYDRHTVSPVDPFAAANKKTCGCDESGLCGCRLGCHCGGKCACGDLCDGKPRAEGATCESDDPKRPWRWTNADGGYWWRYKEAPAPAPIPAPVTYYAPPVRFVPSFGGACRGGG